MEENDKEVQPIKILIVINDAPYGTDKAYNALRLVMMLQKDHADAEVRIFLMADAVACALTDQTTAQGFYNIERMLRAAINKEAQVKACGNFQDGLLMQIG